MSSHRFFSLTAVALLVCAAAYAVPTVKEPAVKSKTSFAIFIDAGTYSSLGPKVDAYKAAVERDGLATYIIADDWSSPDAVKEVILSLYGNKKMPLEGVVFIGDIPIAMVRDAQHLTSAFKMDQSRDWQSSSVPSDRFYDDFDLVFDFIRRDAEAPKYFYYSLSPESAQYISSDIYSARVRAEGPDAVRHIGRWLDKAVAAHNAPEALDNVFVWRGHGYNSEDLMAWSGEQITMREQLPSLFGPEGRVRFFDHTMANPAKNFILEQERSESLDISIGHHHGSEEDEYVNGTAPASGIGANVESIKQFLRSKQASAKDKEALRERYMSSYGVPEAWFATTDSLDREDAIAEEMLDIHVQDVWEADPNVRFVVLDACYNGSFHAKDYIAGAYIFSDGKTIAAQGNTVNSLQDRLPDRYLGLLGCGVRVGEWARLNQTVLETHISGDPTYRWTGSAGRYDAQALLAGRTPAKTWLKIESDGTAPVDLRVAALRMLADLGYSGMDELLADRFYNSPYNAVRIEALTLMAGRRSPAFVGMIARGLGDNSELVRRMSVQYVADCGDPSLAPALAAAMIDEKLSKRENYHFADAAKFFEPEVIKQAMREAYDSRTNLMPGTGTPDSRIKMCDAYAADLAETMEAILNPEVKMSRRLSEIKHFRNYTYHYMVPQIVALVENEGLETELRVAAMEALGWFGYSYNAGAITALCTRVQASDKAPAELKAEARKTQKRIERR